MAAALSLKSYRLSDHKVLHVDVHPTQPWVVFADSSEEVVVWDWEHCQVLYDLNAAGVDEKRLIDAQLQRLAEGDGDLKGRVASTETIRGGSVKQVKFYDDDIRYWKSWMARTAASEAPSASAGAPIGGGPLAIRGRRSLVICCENKAIFLDLVSMRARDIPKTFLDNKTPNCVEFLPRATGGDGPYVVFGCPDGIIRVLSMATRQPVKRFVGGHRGAVSCLLTFFSVQGETMLASGGTDGILALWNADSQSRELPARSTIKAHDGGVHSVALARVQGSAPLLITTGADRAVGLWSSMTLKEHRRIKPIAKMLCYSATSWCHPRLPTFEVLTVIKDNHIWAIENFLRGGNVGPRPLGDLQSLIPPGTMTATQSAKKLKIYCIEVHPLQPHILVAATSHGVMVCEFEPRCVPSAVPLPLQGPGSKEHMVVYAMNREVSTLSFQLAPSTTPALERIPTMSMELGVGGPTRPRAEADLSQPQVRQSRNRRVTATHDSYAVLAASKSGRYVSVMWPDGPSYTVYRASDWSIVDTGAARLLAWDTCADRYAMLAIPPTPATPKVKQGSSRKAKEAAAVQAQAVQAAAQAMASATVEIKQISDTGVLSTVCKAIEGRKEQVIDLQGGAMLGVAYRMSKAKTPVSVSASMPGGLALVTGAPGTAESTQAELAMNFQLFSWETYKPVSGLVPQPEWTAWDQTVEYCALAYAKFVTICALRPTFRYLGSVAITGATGGIWHRRQLFLATPTTIECVFADAGVDEAEEEAKRAKAAAEAAAKATEEAGELAVLTLDVPQQPVIHMDKLKMRPPMLQVVRLASFQTQPSVPPISGLQKSKMDGDSGPVLHKPEETEKAAGGGVAVAGGGVSVAASRLPAEQRRPIGPLIVVGVRDAVLWLVDRYMTAHAIALSHPGIRCRCLAAYGDAVSAVKWASRLGREHHDDLAHFMVGMSYIREALHLPGLSKRLEFDLAIQCGELPRALHCLLGMSGTKNFAAVEAESADSLGVLALGAQQSSTTQSVAGVARFAQDFLELIDAADATGQRDIAMAALKRLAAAGVVEGALKPSHQRSLALQLAAHGEMSRLTAQADALVAAGQGREAAVAAAFLNDQTLLERVWEETGMFPEAALHAKQHGRPSLPLLVQKWNRMLVKQALATATAGVPQPLGSLPSSQQATPRATPRALQKATSFGASVFSSLTSPNTPLVQGGFPATGLPIMEIVAPL